MRVLSINFPLLKNDMHITSVRKLSASENLSDYNTSATHKFNHNAAN